MDEAAFNILLNNFRRYKATKIAEQRAFNPGFAQDSGPHQAFDREKTLTFMETLAHGAVVPEEQRNESYYTAEAVIEWYRDSAAKLPSKQRQVAAYFPIKLPGLW
ncbi:MAG: hypothetical protein Q8Q92_03175 [bacterium]|nr:hypothetical protein [bacterium]